MSITTIFSVFCDRPGCGQWVAQVDSLKKARQAADAEHWQRRRGDGRMLDLCPVCAGVPCELGEFSACLIHKSYVTDDSGVCQAVRETRGQH